VALDPRLTWIYAAAAYMRGPNEAVKPEWLAKAEAADPDNAVPYLLAADATADRHRTSASGQRAQTEPEVRASLTSNPQWLALMDKAFHAPHYESYFPRHTELNREIWRRVPGLPFTVALQGLWMHSLPNMYYLRIFATFLIQQSEKERIAGHSEKAKELLQEVDAFGARMQNDGSTDIERLMGRGIQKDAAHAWKAFYEATGRPEEAQAAAQRVAQIEEDARANAAERQHIWKQRERGTLDGWLVQISAFVILLAVLLAIVSIGLFEVRPAIWKSEPGVRRVASWVADFAPVVALISSVALLVSFLPYARVFAAFRAGNPGAPDERVVMAQFWSLLGVTWRIGGADAAVGAWTALTVVLSLTAALILARMVYRALRPTIHA
jgi:hypothetical protein